MIEINLNFLTQRYKGTFQKHKQCSLCQGKRKRVLNLLHPRKKARQTFHEPSFLDLQNEVVGLHISKFYFNSNILQFINCKIKMKKSSFIDHNVVKCCLTRVVIIARRFVAVKILTAF